MSVSVLGESPDDPLQRFQEALRQAQEVSACLGVEDLPEALGEAEKLKARLSVRLYSVAAPRPIEEDHLLEVEEAARRLAISTDTLYRKARDLPFTVRIGGNVRFSAQGISRFIARRQGR